MPCCLIYARTDHTTAARHAACRTYTDAHGWRIATIYVDIHSSSRADRVVRP